ncbi:MAG: uracil-DNA glycosylase [Gammaproteobacteria bacterium]|nr:uracil-DNA glycosylase [Gammaproteobacteria bacterium]
MGIDVWVPRQHDDSRRALAEAEDSAGRDDVRFSRARHDFGAADSLSADSAYVSEPLADKRQDASPQAETKQISGERPFPEGAEAEAKPAGYAEARDNAAAPAGEVASLDWEALKERVAGCTLCGLEKTRTRTVFGVGSHTADWLFIGEAPGRDEDAQGEPFVGRAGQLLNNMLKAIGLTREQVFIANVLKCRPPKNRDPKPIEALACEPYLKRQIVLLKPRIIIALGRVAAQNLLRNDTPIGRMRGQQYVYADTGIPLLVTYHPAYLLRSPLEKRRAWADLLQAKKLVAARGRP